MFKLNTIAPEDATGSVASAYAVFPAEIGVPAAFRMMSASPERMIQRLKQMQVWSEHPTFDRQMQISLRFLFSCGPKLSNCRRDNEIMLRSTGMTSEQIQALDGDPEHWPLGPKRNALVHFVADSLKNRRSATVEDVANLRTLGWTDAEIFDALDFGGMVMATTTLVDILKD